MAKPLNYSVIYIGRQSLSLRFSSKYRAEKKSAGGRDDPSHHARRPDVNVN
jgi:hypothetical protein